jgi:hypothetical protein
VYSRVSNAEENRVEALMRNPEVVTLVLLSCLLTFLPVFAPAGGLMLSILAPFPLIVLGVKYPWSCVLGVLAVETVVLLAIEGLSTLFVLTYYAVVPLLMAAAIRRGMTMSQTIVWSVCVPTVLSLFVLGMYSLMQQQSPSALLTQYIEQALQGDVEPAKPPVSAPELVPESELPLPPAPAEGGLDPQDMRSMAQVLPRLVLTLLPALLVVNYLLTNVVNYGVVYWYCKRSRPPLHIHTEALASWRVSDYLVWVFLASGVLLLLPFGILSHVGLNVFVVTLALYLLQGVAIAAFWGLRLPIPPGARLLLALLVLLVAGPLFVVLFTAAGLFDLWVDFRRQRHHPLVS